jgi:hypothetical protein
MLTLILLGLLGGSGWYGVRQRRRARKAEAQLKRIAAASDDELRMILEATDTPMAKKLLATATTTGVSVQLVNRFIRDFNAANFSRARRKILKRYVDDGMIVDSDTYTQIIRCLAFESDKNKARDLLRNKIVDE